MLKMYTPICKIIRLFGLIYLISVPLMMLYFSHGAHAEEIPYFVPVDESDAQLEFAPHAFRGNYEDAVLPYEVDAFAVGLRRSDLELDAYPVPIPPLVFEFYDSSVPDFVEDMSRGDLENKNGIVIIENKTKKKSKKKGDDHDDDPDADDDDHSDEDDEDGGDHHGGGWGWCPPDLYCGKAQNAGKGYGSFYPNSKVGPRRQYWDYSSNSYPVHKYYQNHKYTKSTYDGFSHPLDQYTYSFPKYSKKLSSKYWHLRNKLNKLNQHKKHYAVGWGW